MKAIAITTLVAGLAAVALAQAPDMPKPTAEHKWLDKLIGEWEGEGGGTMNGMEFKCKATETVVGRGGFWTHSEFKGDMGGMAMTGAMTLGYDAEKKKYIGTWVDSCTSHLWNYTGSVSKDGKTLTLEATGPDMTKPGATCNFRDVTEFKSDTEKTFTSYFEKDGKWVKMMSMTLKKKGK